MGTARGKLGEMVLSRRNGQQIARTYVANVKNPRSEGQITQRIKLANLVAGYRILKEAIARGFENKPENRSVYNEFVSANLATNAVSLSREEANAGAFVIAPYQVTRGTMPEILQTVNDGVMTLSLPISATFTVDATTTVSDLTAQLMQSPEWNIGDELAIVVLQQRVNNLGFPTAAVRKYSMVLSNVNLSPVIDLMPEGFAIQAGITTITPTFNAGIFAVHTRENANGKLMVSSSSISLIGDALFIDNYNSEEQRSAARASYGVQSAAFLSPQSGSSTDGDFPQGPVPSVTNVRMLDNGQYTDIVPGEPYINQGSQIGKTLQILGNNLTPENIGAYAPIDAARPQDGIVPLTLLEYANSYHESYDQPASSVYIQGGILRISLDFSEMHPQGITPGTTATSMLSGLYNIETGAILWGTDGQ